MLEVMSLNSYFDGYVLASATLGVGRVQAYARLPDGFEDVVETEEALQRFDRRKFRVSDDMVLTGDYVKSRADTGDWLRGLARAVLDRSQALAVLAARADSGEDEGADLLRRVVLGLLTEGEDALARMDDAQRASRDEHVRVAGDLLDVLGRMPQRQRVDVLNGFLRLLSGLRLPD